MKFLVDEDRCSGHGRCYVMAGNVFRADADGYNKDRGVLTQVAPGCEDEAERGALSCPEGAIAIVREGESPPVEATVFEAGSDRR